jgi:predicted nucleic acid-binding protein
MGSAWLIDSNVLIYSVDRRDPEKQSRALRLLGALGGMGFSAAVSTQTLAEFFTGVTCRLPDALPAREACKRVVELVESFMVCEVTLAVVLEATRAVREHRMSYWDAQVWATAKLNQIPYVLSEDLQGWGELEGVRFVNPLADGFDLRAFARG